jgi:hypothetical protein
MMLIIEYPAIARRRFVMPASRRARLHEKPKVE